MQSTFLKGKLLSTITGIGADLRAIGVAKIVVVFLAVAGSSLSLLLDAVRSVLSEAAKLPTPLWATTATVLLLLLLLYVRLRISTSPSSDAAAKILWEATLKKYEEHILHSGALVYVKKITPEYPVQTVYYSAVCMGVQRASPMFPAANGDSLFCHECNLKIGVYNMRPIFPKTLISPLNERRE